MRETRAQCAEGGRGSVADIVVLVIKEIDKGVDYVRIGDSEFLEPLRGPSRYSVIPLP